MSKKAIKPCVVLLFVASVVIAQVQSSQEPAAMRTESLLGRIKNYRDMVRVNKDPVDMVESTKFMCAPPSMVYGPHYDPGVVYYINELASQGLKTFSGNKLFPVGSIIVKEKQSKRDGAYLENLGTYNPTRNPAEIKLDLARVNYWIDKGAQPTETVNRLIKASTKAAAAVAADTQ